jgi:hypothetical protein
MHSYLLGSKNSAPSINHNETIAETEMVLFFAKLARSGPVP